MCLSRWSQQHLPLSRLCPWNGSHCGHSVRNLHSKVRGGAEETPTAWVQLRSQLAGHILSMTSNDMWVVSSFLLLMLLQTFLRVSLGTCGHIFGLCLGCTCLTEVEAAKRFQRVRVGSHSQQQHIKFSSVHILANTWCFLLFFFFWIMILPKEPNN